MPSTEVSLDFSRCNAQTLAHRAYQNGMTVTTPWGRGIGKSWFMRMQWYLDVAKHDGHPRPGTNIRGIRRTLLMPTLKQAKRVHANLMLAELGRSGEWAFLGARINKTDWEITFPGGSWIKWVSAENANDNRGLRTDAVDLDEADDIDPEVWNAVVKPWFSEPFSFRKTLISGTPRRGRHGLLYLTAKTLPKTEKTYKSFHCTSLDAPDIVDPAYVEEARRTTPKATFAREWLCDFDSAEGLVYPHFSEDFHIREAPPGTVFREILIGADHGWEDFGVFLVIGVTGSGKDETYWILEEVVATHKDEDWWCAQAAKLAKKYLGARWYPDPSMPSRNSALATKGKAKLIWRDYDAGIVATDNSIEDGVATVGNALGIREAEGDNVPSYAHLYVSPKCRFTIGELTSYKRKRDPRNADRILEDIEDKNNHAMDALRYALHTWKPRGLPGPQRGVRSMPLLSHG